MTAWTCDTHRVTTTGDCPKCDGDLIALTQDVAAPLTLTDFLLARIAEDEDGIDDLCAPMQTPTEWRARVMAECEAKRRIVEYCPSASENGDAWDTAFWRVLQMLALPYANHPDYREDWA